MTHEGEKQSDGPDASSAWLGSWRKTDDELPPLETPVWAWNEQDQTGPIIACRTQDNDADGWLWGRCYDAIWWDNGWHTDTADEDDYHFTHWMPLPEPPHANP